MALRPSTSMPAAFSLAVEAWSGDGAADAYRRRGEGIDEEVDGGTGADADDAVVADPFERPARRPACRSWVLLMVVRSVGRSSGAGMLALDFQVRKGRSPLSRVS